ncbi:MAG: hypothetical protein GHCLOJNM_01594 [bacterium]|nr:hypothetical protein [bacterium]
MKIDPDTAYTKAALVQLLGDAVDVDEFLHRLKPKKCFRGLWLGSDILDAWRRCPAITSSPHPHPPPRRTRADRSATRHSGLNLI